MNKKYTRKQILESIKYWKKQLNECNYRKLNESIEDYRVDYVEDDAESDRISQANPLQIMYNYPDVGSSFSGVVAATSKNTLKNILQMLIDDGLSRARCSKPMITDEEPPAWLDEYSSIANTTGTMDVNFIVDNVLKGKYVSYLVSDTRNGNDSFPIVFFKMDPNEGSLCFIEELYCENK